MYCRDIAGNDDGQTAIGFRFQPLVHLVHRDSRHIASECQQNPWPIGHQRPKHHKGTEIGTEMGPGDENIFPQLQNS